LTTYSLGSSHPQLTKDSANLHTSIMSGWDTTAGGWGGEAVKDSSASGFGADGKAGNDYAGNGSANAWDNGAQANAAAEGSSAGAAWDTNCGKDDFFGNGGANGGGHGGDAQGGEGGCFNCGEMGHVYPPTPCTHSPYTSRSNVV
jgi:hypothetical protein